MLIGLTGKKQSGKDTAANFLVERGWVKIGFADPLRECLAAMNPILDITRSCVTGKPHYTRYRDAVGVLGYDKAKSSYPEVRRLLQVFGTEVGRDIIGKYLGNPWLQIADIRIQQALIEDKHVVISDVRFPDEAELIHRLGGKVVRVYRDVTYHNEDSHRSESGISDSLVDHTVINNDALGHLRQYILRLADGLLRQCAKEGCLAEHDGEFSNS